MAEPYLGQISMFGGNFAPRGWALCEGQLLAVNENQALFSILGTTYGGDGQSTFGLPDMRGRTTLHAGTGPGLTPRTLGECGGQANVALTLQQIAPHTHNVHVSGSFGDTNKPEENSLATTPDEHALYAPPGPTNPTADPRTICDEGQGHGHNNMQPFLGINFIIALEGATPLVPPN